MHAGTPIIYVLAVYLRILLLQVQAHMVLAWFLRRS